MKSIEEILQEAKQKYPVGCMVSDAKYGGEAIELASIDIWSDGVSIIANTNYLYLYTEGMWAEIHSLPKNNTYEIF